jgi:hypothetical protein
MYQIMAKIWPLISKLRQLAVLSVLPTSAVGFQLKYFLTSYYDKVNNVVQRKKIY